MNQVDKIRGCIFGVACGDALGVSLEFMDPLEIERYYPGGLKEIVGGGWMHLREGEYTDDTQLMKLLSLSLIEKKEFDLKDIAKKYVDWKKSNPLDIGDTTKEAIENLEKGINPYCSGVNNPTNGSLMRAAPIGIVSQNKKIEYCSMFESAITHSNSYCRNLCVVNNNIINSCIKNNKKGNQKTMKNIIKSQLSGRFKRFHDFLINEKIPYNPSGNIIETFHASIYALRNNNNFEDTLIQAVNFGGDSDTVGAITGGIAGAYYGFDAIPKKWIKSIETYENFVINNKDSNFVKMNYIANELVKLQGQI